MWVSIFINIGQNARIVLILQNVGVLKSEKPPPAFFRKAAKSLKFECKQKSLF